MGSGLEGSCSCGFVVPSFAAGGGMANFTTTCWAPAYCATCRTVIVRNYLSKRPRCGTCRRRIVFYDDPSLRAPAGAEDHSDAGRAIVFSWWTEAGQFLLPAARYLCPACREFGLEFHDSGLMWD
jgi:hypothetical protein